MAGEILEVGVEPLKMAIADSGVAFLETMHGGMHPVPTYAAWPTTAIAH